MRPTHFIPFLFILLEACIDPLSVQLLSGTQKFVVDGLITNDPGPYEIKLSYSTSLDNTLKKAPIASGASVWIYDNDIPEKLTEVSPGSYQTSKTGIRGQQGHEYYIRIKTKFGREYQSQPQRLSPAGEIANISFQFVPNGILGKKPEQFEDGQYIDAVKILVDAKGMMEDEQNLLRWRWTTMYKVRTFPELRRRPVDPGIFENGIWYVPTVPSPEPCSGYVNNGGAIQQIGVCTCCECWPYNTNSRALISHNRVVDGNEFKQVDLGKIPATRRQFYDKYYLMIEQLSLSEEVYRFWDLVEKQESGQGNLFQPNSVKVKGNIQSLTDPEEEVLGIFGVSGITRKEMYIPADVVPFKLTGIDTIYHDCSDSFYNDYNVKPSFW